MNVKIVDHDKDPFDIIGAGTEGVLKQYVNKKTGLDDPMVVYPSGRFLHTTTIRNAGGTIISLDSGEVVDA